MIVVTGEPVVCDVGHSSAEAVDGHIKVQNDRRHLLIAGDQVVPGGLNHLEAYIVLALMGGPFGGAIG